MKADTVLPPNDGATLTRLPDWITAAAQETPENVAFLSGAALAHLHLVAKDPAIPHALWRARLALVAAEICVKVSGRRERATALRDAVHLTRVGDNPGPAGAIFQHWSHAVALPVTGAHLSRALPDLATEQIAGLLAVGRGAPMDRAAAVLEAVLSEAPRAETAALILADAALARAVGWDHLLPLLAMGIDVRDLRLRGDSLRFACHRALLLAAGQAVPLAADLARRAARLQAVAPRLRAKGADAAVALFLSRDAVTPSTLTHAGQGGMSDRAARRLCDRLVELGAVRELTGRDSYRLYGV